MVDIKKIAKAMNAIHVPLDGRDPLDVYMERKAKEVLKWLVEQEEVESMKKAVCILVYNDDGEILAVSRKNDPNDLGLPGGKVDPGETEEEAVVREMLEETGLEISKIGR